MWAGRSSLSGSTCCSSTPTPSSPPSLLTKLTTRPTPVPTPVDLDAAFDEPRDTPRRAQLRPLRSTRRWHHSTYLIEMQMRHTTIGFVAESGVVGGARSVHPDADGAHPAGRVAPRPETSPSARPSGLCVHPGRLGRGRHPDDDFVDIVGLLVPGLFEDVRAGGVLSSGSASSVPSRCFRVAWHRSGTRR